MQKNIALAFLLIFRNIIIFIFVLCKVRDKGTFKKLLIFLFFANFLKNFLVAFEFVYYFF